MYFGLEVGEADTKQGGKTFQSSRRPECSSVVGSSLVAMGVKLLKLLGFCGLTPAISKCWKPLKPDGLGVFLRLGNCRIRDPRALPTIAGFSAPFL